MIFIFYGNLLSQAHYFFITKNNVYDKKKTIFCYPKRKRKKKHKQGNGVLDLKD
jgi:hypothetical protein